MDPEPVPPSVCAPLQQLISQKRSLCDIQHEQRLTTQSSLHTLTAAEPMRCSRHGVAVAPTMQCYEQPVSQDLLARVLWEFQHVDTGAGGRQQVGGEWHCSDAELL